MNMDRQMRDELKNYEEKLFNKISHERFSLKKLVHLYEYKCIYDGIYNA